MQVNAKKIKNELEFDMHDDPQVVKFRDNMLNKGDYTDIEMPFEPPKSIVEKYKNLKPKPPKINFVIPKMNKSKKLR